MVARVESSNNKPDVGSRKYSEKGFVAIDLDGTALVQKIDKNKWYGFTHRRKDLRRSLITYIRMAQMSGYDIVILTSRPKLVEKVFLEPGEKVVGTLATKSIVNALRRKNIHIAEVIRVPFKYFKEGMKGASMVNIIKRYRKNGSENAEGILFDDQLKQVEDVEKKSDVSLFAYDINSIEDLQEFVKKMKQTTAESVNKIPSEIQQKINALKQKIALIDDKNYKQEINVLNLVLDDLTIRLKESEEYAYTPEVKWVDKALNNTGFLINKLSKKSPITHKDIRNASKAIFAKTHPSKFEPDTKCARTIKNFLIYIERLPILADIKRECKTYRDHLMHKLGHNNSQEKSRKKIQNKLRIVDIFLEKLSNENPTLALDQFNTVFKENEKTFRTSKTGYNFVSKIYSLLLKIPILSQLFKTDGEKLLEAIEYKKMDYRNSIYYKKELDSIQSNEEPPWEYLK